LNITAPDGDAPPDNSAEIDDAAILIPAIPVAGADNDIAGVAGLIALIVTGSSELPELTEAFAASPL
jgi:hypothetical protein